MWQELAEDLKCCSKNSRWRDRILVILFSLEFHTLALYRIAHWVRKRKYLAPLSAPLLYLQQVISGCHINPHAEIGRNCRFPHPNGIVIGERTRIGNNVRIFQQVTLGSHGSPDEEAGYPTIGDHAVLFAGATVIGPVNVGHFAVVGARSLVLHDVPDYSVVAGIPARILRQHA